MSHTDARPRVAVIEDDPALLDVMRDVLELEDYDVQVCPEVEGGYAFVKRAAPDLVILDLIANGQPTGWTTLERLRGDPETAPLPVLVCSGAHRAARDAGALASYGARVVAKPFEIDDLLSTVGGMLARGGPRRSSPG
jgi:DNA-binding response OmpR family regulator